MAAAEPIGPSNTRVGWIGDERDEPGDVRPPHPGRLHPHRLQPQARQGPTPRRHRGPLGPLPSRRRLPLRVVFSIVGYPSDVRSVILHPVSGALASLHPGCVLVDMTTSEPSLAAAEAAKGCDSIDAPVSGKRIVKRDFEAGCYHVKHFVKDLGICLKECQNIWIALPGLALAQQLSLSLKARGDGNLGIHALFLVLERLNNVQSMRT